MSEGPTDEPDRAALVVRKLLTLSPFLFVGTLALARLQDASWGQALFIALVALAMCLATAGLYALRGAKAMGDIAWLNVLLRLFVR
jgi:hypothetical protein